LLFWVGSLPLQHPQPFNILLLAAVVAAAVATALLVPMLVALVRVDY
jgi:hypothetical protein